MKTKLSPEQTAKERALRTIGIFTKLSEEDRLTLLNEAGVLPAATPDDRLRQMLIVCITATFRIHCKIVKI